MVTVPRPQLASDNAAATIASCGFSFPFLVRARGSHTGRHFERVENPQELTAAAGEIPSDELCLIDQLEARGADGFYRKLRVMIIDRKIYPLHLATSRHWKIHYFKADMAHSPENRRVDQAFLEDMPRFIGARGMAALERVSAALDLDYCGIDFAVNAAGEILLFESNATMVMVPLSGDPKWDYRRPAFDCGVRRHPHHAVGSRGDGEVGKLGSDAVSARPREGGDPALCERAWIPAFAGMSGVCFSAFSLPIPRA
jgi:hypothetical protein